MNRILESQCAAIRVRVPKWCNTWCRHHRHVREVYAESVDSLQFWRTDVGRCLHSSGTLHLRCESHNCWTKRGGLIR